MRRNIITVITIDAKDMPRPVLVSQIFEFDQVFSDTSRLESKPCGEEEGKPLSHSHFSTPANCVITSSLEQLEFDWMVSLTLVSLTINEVRLEPENLDLRIMKAKSLSNCENILNESLVNGIEE